MTAKPATARRRALRLYIAGQGTIVLGAAAMTWTHSFAPMALAASAGLMLTLPLVRELATRRRGAAGARRRLTGSDCD